MSTILSGNFSIKTDADGAVEELLSGGIESGQICSFAINPPGQHGAHENKGEEDGTAGAPGTSESSIKGAAIGSAVGMGAGAVAGPVGMAGGAAVGAYLGSLAGALNNISGEEADSDLPGEKVAARQSSGASASPGRCPGRHSSAHGTASLCSRCAASARRARCGRDGRHLARRPVDRFRSGARTSTWKSGSSQHTLAPPNTPERDGVAAENDR